MNNASIYLATGIFLLLNAVAIYFEFFWVPVLPLAIAIVALALFRLDWLFMLIVFLTPLSVNVEDIPGGFGLHLPTEPLIFGLMLVFLLRVFYDGHFDKRILWHPLSIAILVNLFWLLITTLTSEDIWVSFKYLLSRTWFVVGFFYIATQVFRDSDNIRRFFWLFAVPLLGVAVYTMIMHAVNGFTMKAAHWVMQPFFKDHTSYGAVLAMFFPLTLGYMWSRNLSITTKIIVGFVIVLMATAIVLSYTRAAWVSLAGALGVFIIMGLRIKFWVVVVVALVGLGAFFSFENQITQKLEKNRQDSSSDLSEHVSSISNVATDASNLERINRWNAALRMFGQRPVLGWGPGTYKFYYAPFQLSADLTIISTNFGDGGNAHSEYFGPLAESGVPGLVTFLVIIGLVAYYAIDTYFKLQSREMRIVLMGVFLGLITYFAHGFLNNFLDLDKASVPFWGFMAVILAIRVYHLSKSEESTAY